jgi:hypothetical protein
MDRKEGNENMKQRRNRFLALLLCLAMVMSLIPATALADQGNEGGEQENAVAETNGIKYESLAAAVAEVSTTDTAEATTITLLKDTEEQILVSDGRNVTLDLAGNKLSYNQGDYTIGISGTSKLTIQDGSEDNSGTVENTYYCSDDGYGNSYGAPAVRVLGLPNSPALNITGGNFSAKGYTIECGAGSVTISGGKFTSENDLDMYVFASQVAISGGEFIAPSNYIVNLILVNNESDTSGDLTVSGGTFSTEKIFTVDTLTNANASGTAQLAEGYVAVDNGNGTWTVVNGSSYYVAQVGEGAKYATLQEAVDAAGSGDTVTLLKDVTVTSAVTVASGKEFTLDLNGHTLSRTDHWWAIENSGNLTIQDSGANGKISAPGAIQNKAGATLTLKSGTIDGTSVETINNKGTAYVQGATVTNSNGGAGFENYGALTVSSGSVSGHNGINNYYNGYLTVSGGSVTGYYCGVYSSKGNSTVIVTGGTITGTNEHGILSFGANSTVTVSGTAKIEGKDYGILNGATSEDGNKPYACGPLTITGGEVTGEYGVYVVGSEATLSGGTITGSVQSVTLQQGANVTVKDNVSLASESGFGIVVLGYQYNGSVTNNYVDETSTPTTKLTVSGGTIKTGAFAISGNGSYDHTNIDISGGTIESTESVAIYHPQVGDLTISGGTITGASGGVQYCGAGTVTISAGTLQSTYQATNFPTKDAAQGDGSFADGAALSIISRAGGYQSIGDTMTVNITGGEFVSTNNSAIRVYRAAQVNSE